MKKVRTLNDKNHTFGRIFLGVAIAIIVAVPVIIGLVLKTQPDWAAVGRCAVPLIIFIAGGFIECLSYGPLLGTMATYLGHITGNLVNLKVPCAVAARDNFGYENGSKEGEIVSTISVGVSTIVTTVVIGLGVLALAPLTPVLENPVLSPAFAMSFTALFGALAFKYFSGSIKLVPVPLVLVLVLQFALNLGYTVLIPVSAIVSILVAYFMWKKGWLDVKDDSKPTPKTEEVAE